VVAALCITAPAESPLCAADKVRSSPAPADASCASVKMRESVALSNARSAFPAAPSAPSKAATICALTVAISFKETTAACAPICAVTASAAAPAVKRPNASVPASFAVVYRV
jgi:hypothetical protein